MQSIVSFVRLFRIVRIVVQQIDPRRSADGEEPTTVPPRHIVRGHNRISWYDRRVAVVSVENHRAVFNVCADDVKISTVTASVAKIERERVASKVDRRARSSIAHAVSALRRNADRRIGRKRQAGDSHMPCIPFIVMKTICVQGAAGERAAGKDEIKSAEVHLAAHVKRRPFPDRHCARRTNDAGIAIRAHREYAI